MTIPNLTLRVRAKKKLGRLDVNKVRGPYKINIALKIGLGHCPLEVGESGRIVWFKSTFIQLGFKVEILS